MSRSYFFRRQERSALPPQRSAWLTSNSIGHQAKVYTAKSLVNVATHLNRDEGCVRLEKVGRSDLQIGNRLMSNCCTAMFAHGVSLDGLESDRPMSGCPAASR